MLKNKSPTASNLWTQSAMTSARVTVPVMMVMVTCHLYPPGTVPIAHEIIQPAEHTAPQGIQMLQVQQDWALGTKMPQW